MPKKESKKGTKKDKTKKHQQKTKKVAKKSKLDPGKKLCRSCGHMIAIHKKVCGECGHVHQMRKKKEDVLRNLNKITPIIIKSIIQNNDFNQFKGWNQDFVFKVGALSSQERQLTLQKNPSEQSAEAQSKAISRRRSQQPKNESSQTTSHNLGPSFKQLNMANFFSLNLNHPISSICSSKNWFVVCQNLNKSAVGLTHKELMTIEAYQLQKFHLVGVDYIGNSNLYFSKCASQMNNPTTLQFWKISLPHCVLSMKIYCNLLVLLTGKSSLLIFSLTSNFSATFNFSIQSSLQIIEPLPDKITSFQFLRSTAQKQNNKNLSVLLVVGTLHGHISIYKLNNQGYTIIRYIPNAHRQMITTISQCPLNQVAHNQQNQQNQDSDSQEDNANEGVLFASGCYDGNVSIWNIQQKQSIFTCQCSNRKIWSIYWDPGAKYLLINRQQLNDTCIILCLYSINKIETSIHLSTTIQTRSIKTNLNSTICHHNYYSKYLPIIDTVNGIFRIFQMEDLRGNSLKKKKNKKQENSDLYYRIVFKNQGEYRYGRVNKHVQRIGVQVEQFVIDGQEEEKKKKTQKLKQEPKKFPIFSGVSIQTKQNADFVYFAAYNGVVIAYKQPNKSNDQ